MERTLWYIFGGVAGVALLGAAFASAMEPQPGSLEALKRDFRSYFDIAPDCSEISFKNAVKAEQFWAETAGPLLDAMISLLAPATSDPDEITRITLTYIFPTCSWPAPEDRLDQIALQEAVRFAVGD